MGFREHFRTIQEWSDSTNNVIKLNTQSDVAAKEYDLLLTQLVAWYEDERFGGLSGAIDRMLTADPEFVLGRAIDLELQLMGALSSPRLDSQMAKSLVEFNKLVEEKDFVSEQEHLHCQVVNYWANSELKEASQVLERIVTLYPEDVSALKMLQDTYFMLGSALPMRNSLAFALPKMSQHNPLKGWAHGMFAFALEESNMYPQAQREAEKAIEMNDYDTWAIHAYAHCFEMQGKAKEGLEWMLSKRESFDKCDMLACHQYWHTALFQINQGNYNEAIALLDEHVLSRLRSRKTSLDLHDAASMIYRMELVDLFSVAQKHSSKEEKHKLWVDVHEMCKPHKRDHLLGFNDAHFMMSYLGMDDLETARELIDSIDECQSLIVGQTVVKPLLEAMYQFKVGNYAKCVHVLEPIRFDIIKIGGSHAQRDLFEQLLLVAAIKSDKEADNMLAQRMIVERDTLLGGRVPQTALLLAQQKQHN